MPRCLACGLVLLLITVCRATSPELPPSPLNIYQFNDTVVIAWPMFDNADQTGRALLTAVNAATGEEQWSWRGPQRLYTRQYVLAVRHAEPLLIVPEYSGKSLAISIRTGNVVWKSSTLVPCGPVGMTEEGDAINLDTGAVAWKLGHRLFGTLIGIDDASNHGLVIGTAPVPFDASTPITLKLLDLTNGKVLAQGDVKGLRSILLLGQRGDLSMIADDKTLLTLDLKQGNPPAAMSFDDPKTREFLKERGVGFRYDSPPPVTSWARPGIVAVAQTDQTRSVGLVRLYAAADGKMLAETRIANIASDSPPQTRTSSTARAPSAVAIPRPLLLFSIIGFTTALLALGALLYRLNRARPYSAQGA